MTGDHVRPSTSSERASCCSPVPAGTAWIAAAEAVTRSLRVPVTGVAVHEVNVAAAYELAHGEAVLVRPDGHVAWRSGPMPTRLSPQDAVTGLPRPSRQSPGPELDTPQRDTMTHVLSATDECARQSTALLRALRGTIRR